MDTGEQETHFLSAWQTSILFLYIAPTDVLVNCVCDTEWLNPGCTIINCLTHLGSVMLVAVTIALYENYNSFSINY
jgi:hypothetical protein